MIDFTPLVDLIKTGKTQAAKELINIFVARNQIPELCAYKDLQGRSVLHIAMDASDDELMEYLIDKGMPISTTDHKNFSLLCHAVFSQNKQRSILLLKKGANLTDDSNQKIFTAWNIDIRDMLWSIREHSAHKKFISQKLIEKDSVRYINTFVNFIDEDDRELTIEYIKNNCTIKALLDDKSPLIKIMKTIIASKSYGFFGTCINLEVFKNVIAELSLSENAEPFINIYSQNTPHSKILKEIMYVYFFSKNSDPCNTQKVDLKIFNKEKLKTVNHYQSSQLICDDKPIKKQKLNSKK